MFRAVIIGPFQDELAEGFGSTRLTALEDAKSNLGSWNTALYEAGECSVEYHHEDDAFGDEHSDSNHYCEWR